MMNDYKGYTAKVVLDEEHGVLHGEIVGIADVVTFQGTSVSELVQAFHESVDDYLAYCEERGEEPNKPYSGRFVARVSPELHRQLSIAATKADVSMNDFVVSALEEAVKAKRTRTSTEAPESPEIEHIEALAAKSFIAFDWLLRDVLAESRGFSASPWAAEWTARRLPSPKRPDVTKLRDAVEAFFDEMATKKSSEATAE